MHILRLSFAAPIATLLFAIACTPGTSNSHDGGTSGADAGAKDAGWDAGWDAGQDAGSDAATDAGSHEDGGSTDAGSTLDAGWDAGWDAGATDAGSDAGSSSSSSSDGGTTTVLYESNVTVGTTLTFTLPFDTTSVTIIEQAVSAPSTITCSNESVDNVAIPYTITSGSTAIYSDLDDSEWYNTFSDASTLTSFFASDSSGTGSFTFPNTTAGLALIGASELNSGTSWSLVVSDFAYEAATQSTSSSSPFYGCSGGSSSSTYDVTVIVKASESSAIPSSGTLNVVLNLIDSTLSSSSTLSSDLARVQSTLNTILGKAGLAVGTVTTNDLSTSLSSYASLDVCADGGIGPLLSKSTTSGAINAFLIEDLNEDSCSDSTSGTSIVGIDGTIPGPAGLSGTIASGVVVSDSYLGWHSTDGGTCPTSSVDYINCGNDALAYILAHEVGHYLGLYHTTESAGTYFDPLSDTAECSSSCISKSHGSSSSSYVSVTNCLKDGGSCGGGNNLMFWLFDPDDGSAAALSTQQGEVMRANPTAY